MAPLSHHQILQLAAPFSQAGLQVDLPASDRAARWLAFRPRAHAAKPGAHPALTETLQLDAADPGRLVLTRRLSGPAGLQADLVAEGTDGAALLARLDAVPPGRQWQQGAGWRSATSHRVIGPADAPNQGLQPIAMHAELGAAAAGAWHLHWQPPPVHSRLGPLQLQPPPGVVPAEGRLPPLPEDLLAVLGHAWTRITPRDDGWHGFLRQRPQGWAEVEARLARTAAHLAVTLGAAPVAFHDRHAWARWRVVARRAVPALVSLGLVGAAAAVPRLALDSDSVLRMLILNAPPLLLIAFFCFREVPRIEIPPLPRALRQPRWLPDATVTPPAPVEPAASATTTTTTATAIAPASASGSP